MCVHTSCLTTGVFLNVCLFVCMLSVRDMFACLSGMAPPLLCKNDQTPASVFSWLLIPLFVSPTTLLHSIIIYYYVITDQAAICSSLSSH